MATEHYCNKLTRLEIKTAGLSLDKSTTLLCVDAGKRKDYTHHSKIVLRINAEQDILNIYVSEQCEENEQQYRKLLKPLRKQKIVPITVPSVTISAYCHTTNMRTRLYGLKLSCDSFQLANKKEETT